MKNLRKVLAVMMVFVLVLGLALPTIAATPSEIATYAERLYELGLYAGVDPNTYVPALNDNLTREQAFVLFAKIMGKADRAASVSQSDIKKHLDDAFTDANQFSDWAKPFATILVMDKDVAGKGNGVMGPQDIIKGNELAVLMLKAMKEAMDYDISVRACHVLSDKDILTSGEATELNDIELNRGNAIVIFWNTIANGKIKDGEYVAKFLCEQGVMSEDSARAAGLLEAYDAANPEPEPQGEPVIETVGVNMDYYKQVIVTYSVPITWTGAGSVSLNGDRVPENVETEGYKLILTFDDYLGEGTEVVTVEAGAVKGKDDSVNAAQSIEFSIPEPSADFSFTVTTLSPKMILAKMDKKHLIEGSKLEIYNTQDSKWTKSGIPSHDIIVLDNQHVLIVLEEAIENYHETKYRVRFDKERLQDYATGIINSKAYNSDEFTYEIDTTEPGVEYIQTPNNGSVEIQFTEPVNTKDILLKVWERASGSDPVIQDASNGDFEVEWDSYRMKARFNISDLVIGTEYYVTVENLLDDVGNKSKEEKHRSENFISEFGYTVNVLSPKMFAVKVNTQCVITDSKIEYFNIDEDKWTSDGLSVSEVKIIDNQNVLIELEEPANKYYKSPYRVSFDAGSLEIIATGVKNDSAMNSEPFTIAEDMIKPRIESFNATLNGDVFDIETVFSEPVDATDIVIKVIEKVDGGDDKVVKDYSNGDLEVTWDIYRTKATFSVSGMQPNIAYNVVFGSFKDDVGNAVSESAYKSDELKIE